MPAQAGAERSDSGQLLRLKSLIKKPGKPIPHNHGLLLFIGTPFRLLWPRRPWEEPLMDVRLKENSGRPIISAVSPASSIHPPRPESHWTQLGGLLMLTLTGRRRELTSGRPVRLLRIEIVRAKAYDTHERQT